MRIFTTRLTMCAAGAALASAPVAAEPIPFIHAPAKAEAPVRVEAALFAIDVVLPEAGKLSSLLVESGVSEGEAASAAALAEVQVDDHQACRVKLAMSRNPDNGAISLQRLVLSTAAAQTVIEQRGNGLRVISTAANRLRTA